MTTAQNINLYRVAAIRAAIRARRAAVLTNTPAAYRAAHAAANSAVIAHTAARKGAVEAVALAARLAQHDARIAAGLGGEHGGIN